MVAKRYPDLGKKLRTLLFEKGMKPIDLARAVNLPQPTIHRLVTGKSTRPYPSSLKPIADFFSISVDDLLGEAIKPQKIRSTTSIEDEFFRDPENKTLVPVITWSELTDLKNACQQSKKHFFTLGRSSSKAFALIMLDSSMDPVFAKGTLLVLDPNEPAKDRACVLVYLQESNIYVFRQLLIDGEHRYLKAINPELTAFKIRELQKNDVIIGSLIESRNRHATNDRQNLLEHI